MNFKLIEALYNGPLKSLAADRYRHAKAASVAFLYIYMTLAGRRRPSFNFSTRATLPVGAGLGSSASFSLFMLFILQPVLHRTCACAVTDEEEKLE